MDKWTGKMDIPNSMFTFRYLSTDHIYYSYFNSQNAKILQNYYSRKPLFLTNYIDSNLSFGFTKS